MVISVREAGRKRWKGVSDEEKKAATSTASRAYWDALSPEERSAEMKRRAAKRKKKPAKRSS